MRTTANGIEIEYETFGSPSNEALLLIMGLGAQLTLWDPEFCEALSDRGYYTIRFDNRDVGLSAHFDHAGVPDLTRLRKETQAGATLDVPYTLDDMADDAAGLLEALSIERAHVVGASMGGMIAQTVAIRHAPRVRSLVSIMSTTGNPAAPQAKPELLAQLLAPPAHNREGQLEQSLALRRAISSPGFPFDEARARRNAARDYDRAFHPQGSARHMAAIVAHGNREAALGALTVPTLVIHGSDDPLVLVGNGELTAQAIPDAELLLIEGMGHDIPPGLFSRLADAIAGNAKLAS